MPARFAPPLLLSLALALAGCTTVGPAGSADRAVSATPSAAVPSATGPSAAAPRALTAAALRAAALAGPDLAPGWTVTVVTPGQSSAAPTAADHEVSDVPACQPVLDAIGPANPTGEPTAETDLSLTRAASPGADVYAALLAYPVGRAALLQSALDQVLARCGSFTSTATGTGSRKGAKTQHRLARTDTPTPEGADGATAFTLTSGSATPGDPGAAALSQDATVVRVGTALAVFSTVGTGKEPAAAPDPAVVQAQTRKLRAAQK
ncbi:hypothetical protein P3T37_005392 [Kitasatospora sp. MAA4]|uniref:hypothetical protein n=1 Tax=Kitasatospora sp. MAA4 TaxID=3035093 RepID=UPI0024759CB5|nr:hypothetical protein [Kitasatospora sp. MAA4]MDH6135973.1 hypothetical protein [Kitasatospora sp. MAA4]